MPHSPTTSQKARRQPLSKLVVDVFNDDQACLDLARAAAELCDAPIALVSLQVGDQMWFKTRVGLDVEGIPKHASFCECAMRGCDDVLVVEDASADPRFANNDLVTGPLGIRFYVGAPLLTSKSEVLGNLCVLDTKPKKLDPKHLATIIFLGRQVAAILEKSKRI